MENNNKTNIIVETTVSAPVEKVWEYFTKPEHVTKWNNASETGIHQEQQMTCV